MKIPATNNNLISEIEINQISYDVNSKQTTVPYTLIWKDIRIDKFIVLTEEESNQWWENDNIIIDLIFSHSDMEKVD